MAVDERTFASKAASWIDAILSRRTDLPYGEARVETSGKGSRKRADLSVIRRGTRKAALLGEIKMPDQEYGRNHLDGELVKDAFTKASRRGVPYFFTWNVNKFALFRTEMEGIPFRDRQIDNFDVTEIRDSEELWKESIQAALQGFLERLLDKLWRVDQGIDEGGKLPLDRLFIARLEGALEEPLDLTNGELERRYGTDAEFRRDLDKWMRQEQGWDLSDVPERVRLNIERAARLSCYAVVNRLVFYEVLRRKFPVLPALANLPFAGAPTELKQALDGRLEQAVRVSRDYETIFAAGDFGSGLPFLSARAGQAWQRLVAGVEGFDFTALDYDIIGQMYEHLIGPAERKKYGQFFTSPEVVDLINAFCVREADATVLDPACGGGTFLVRAYARKRALAEAAGVDKPHQELLREIFGVDVATFPAQLSTTNLAVRELSDEANYPQVAKKDFFTVTEGATLLRLPPSEHDGAAKEREVFIAKLDAVVGNPPYIRQEGLSKREKEGMHNLLGREYGGPEKPRFSGRSDIYVYFFAHAGALLREGGYLGLVTSVGWLDTEYGFRLQEFFLNHFRIIAVLESQVEKWFEDARVTTAVTILVREPDEAKRRENIVRFIQLRRPLGEIYSSVLKGGLSEKSEAARQADMEAIRDLIEEISENEGTDYWRVRLKTQGDLWAEGCAARLGEEDDGAEGEGERTYKAGKWGQYLRAPDVHFELLERCGKGMAPLGEMADVRFGFKSGADNFFCVRDVTDEEIKRAGSPSAFRRKYGISVEQTHKIRLIRDGARGGPHLIEAKYVEPEFHRLTDASRIILRAGDVQKMVINAPLAPAALRGTHLGRYVAYGEQQDWNSATTVVARAKGRPWYSLGLLRKTKRADMFWPMAQQYRHLVPWNSDRLVCNHNLFDVWAREGVQPRVLWAILNSTVVALVKPQFGRAAGIEGNLKTEVVDAKMMLVPDPRGAPAEVQERAVRAATRVGRRLVSRTLVEEFDFEDRRQLDDAVLELLGISDEGERERFRDTIYAALEEQYKATRARELDAQKDRLRSKRKGVASAGDLADEIWASASAALALQEFPPDFLESRANLKSVDLPQGQVEVGRALMDTGGLLRAGTIRVGGRDGDVIEVGSQAVGEFLAAAAACGRYGRVGYPAKEADCAKAVETFRQYCGDLQQRFRELAAERTRDEKKQRAIVSALMRKALSWRRE